jgi:hypothetical protein
MVPLGNVAFTFPFMPEHQPLHTSDILGLVFIMLGLFVYRFMEESMQSWTASRQLYPDEKGPAESDLKRALIAADGDYSDEEV